MARIPFTLLVGRDSERRSELLACVLRGAASLAHVLVVEAEGSAQRLSKSAFSQRPMDSIQAEVAACLCCAPVDARVMTLRRAIGSAAAKDLPKRVIIDVAPDTNIAEFVKALLADMHLRDALQFDGIVALLGAPQSTADIAGPGDERQLALADRVYVVTGREFAAAAAMRLLQTLRGCNPVAPCTLAAPGTLEVETAMGNGLFDVVRCRYRVESWLPPLAPAYTLRALGPAVGHLMVHLPPTLSWLAVLKFLEELHGDVGAAPASMKALVRVAEFNGWVALRSLGGHLQPLVRLPQSLQPRAATVLLVTTRTRLSDVEAAVARLCDSQPISPPSTMRLVAVQ